MRYYLLLPERADASSRDVWVREQIHLLVPMLSFFGPTIRLVRHPHPHVGRTIAFYFFDVITQYLVAVPFGRWFYGRLWDKQIGK